MQFGELELNERLRVVLDGTAYFAYHVAQLCNDEFGGDTLLPNWTRRHLIGHVGYNAAALSRLLDWATTGVEKPMYSSPGARDAEIAEGAELSPDALRKLFEQEALRLGETWQHLPVSAWTAEVRTAQGRLVPASETLWMRSREVWIHAVDLRNGAQFEDFPTVVLDSLIVDIVDAWRRKGLGAELILAIDNRDPMSVGHPSVPAVTVSGPLPALVRWATGRGASGVRTDGAPTTPPRWL
jgi:maleylpyruvate isomerase